MKWLHSKTRKKFWFTYWNHKEIPQAHSPQTKNSEKRIFRFFSPQHSDLRELDRQIKFSTARLLLQSTPCWVWVEELQRYGVWLGSHTLHTSVLQITPSWHNHHLGTKVAAGTTGRVMALLRPRGGSGTACLIFLPLSGDVGDGSGEN